MDEPTGAKIRRGDRPKPHLARIFEAVAAVMELDRHAGSGSNWSSRTAA